MTKSRAELPEEDVTFACQECGKSITFAGERRGHVEECPHCGSFVDVPYKTDRSSLPESITPASQPGRGEAEQPNSLDPGSHTSTQLWIEVFAVLCLAYVPYMFGAVSKIMGWWPTSHPFVSDMLDEIVSAFQVSMPLLVILALGKDPWSLFGIVRPKWIGDALIGCVIWLSGIMGYYFILSLLPPSMLERPSSSYPAYQAVPAGIPACLLCLVACVAGGFAQELVMRGYLLARLERLLRSTAAAVLVTTALFASYHFYQGVAPVIGAAAIGFVYAVSFCVTRRLWPLCVAHAIHNLAISMWT